MESTQRFLLKVNWGKAKGFVSFLFSPKINETHLKQNLLNLIQINCSGQDDVEMAKCSLIINHID
jgi:hypothetical protein